MYNYSNDKPILKSLKQRKWFILIFWFYIFLGIASAGFTYFMFFIDGEKFVITVILTIFLFHRAYLYNCAFNGIDDWTQFRNSKIDVDELAEINEIKNESERKRREKELENKKKEYDRIWKILWKVKLLKRKQELYQKKFNKKNDKIENKIKKLEKDLTPRCDGIKMGEYLEIK